MADPIITKIGDVSAYLDAVAHGFRGTRAEFGELLANSANYAQSAGSAASAAIASAATATTKAGEAATAATAAQNAKTQTEQSASQALTDIAAARSGAISAVQTEGATQTANATAQAQAAATSATTASTKASEASASATTATTKATEAAASATSAANAASAAQGVLESIPEDYSDLSEDVDQLKADLDNLNENTNGKSLFITESLGGPSLTGLIWNINHNVSVSSGTVIDFTLKSYSGELLTFARIVAQKADGTRTALMPVLHNVGESERYTLDDDYVLLNVQLVRSAVENYVNVSYSIVIYDGDNLRTQIFDLKNDAKDSFNSLTQTLPKVDVEIPDSVLFYNVGYFFNSNTAEMERSNSNGWVVSDYIPVGYGITVTGSSYSQYRAQIVEYDEEYNIIGQQKLGAIGSITKTYTPNDGVAYVRLQSTLSTGNIASGTQKTFEAVPMVYHVEKDGSGDYTSLVECIAEATRRMDAVVYVGAGTWDIIDELGKDYLANMSTTQQGIVLKNRVHVICSSKAYIKCLYSGTDANVIDNLSAFNAGKYGFTLENADIEVANVRYCVHDERNAETDHYDNYYINCRMKNTNQTSGSRSQCIGGGLGYDGHVVIEGCTFENPLRDNYGIVSYHNAHGAATDSRSLIEVKGCYFYGTNTFRAGYYGNTTKITQCLVHGNSMGSLPYITQEDPNYSNENMEIIAWNNEIRAT